MARSAAVGFQFDLREFEIQSPEHDDLHECGAMNAAVQDQEAEMLLGPVPFALDFEDTDLKTVSEALVVFRHTASAGAESAAALGTAEAVAESAVGEDV